MRTKLDTKFLSLVAVTLLLSTTNISANNELIENGSFENFTINKDNGKWKLVNFENWSGDGEVWNRDLGRGATKGQHKAELDVGKKSVDSLSQTVTTIENQTYTLSLDAYARKTDSSDFEILIDGKTILEVTPSRDWKKYGVEFIGTGGEQTVSIKEVDSQDSGLGTVIDNVSIRSDKSLNRVIADERDRFEIMEPTGLNQIVEILENDRDVQSKVSEEDIAKAQISIQRMNSLISEAIKVNGLANDGFVSISDSLEINKYLVENYSEEWAKLRTDYSLIEAKSHTVALSTSAVKNVWGKIYNLGFESTNKNRNTTNLEGKKSSSFTTVGYYLGSVTKNDIPELQNSEFVEVAGTTGTKLDMIVQVILTDRGLLRKVATSDLRVGAESADKMNQLIVEAIVENGLGNDEQLTTADIRTINNYLVENYSEKWAELHGDDEDGEETAYHRIQNDGATTRMYADNLMNSIADGIYHLGFETNNANRLLNEDGNKNKTFEKVAWWLDSSLKTDLIAGKFANPEYQEIIGTTGTSLDKMIPYIYNDEGLLLKVSMEDIREGARTANAMNELIVEAIRETGVASDDYISTDEVKELNQYLTTNYLSEWAELHGDDEDDSETGYHRIQNDGAVGVMHNKNTINNLADGIYHLGFETDNANRLLNEDGNKNVTFSSVSYWLNQSLASDYANGTFK